MGDSSLANVEEFQSSLKYFFFLFRKEFSPSLEAAACRQWSALGHGDAVVREDGQNNPLVELKLDPDFGRALCAALADSRGNLPSLSVPQTAEQVSFWRVRASETLFPEAIVELSENCSHWETIRETMAWFASCQSSTCEAPLRVCILGASARYEYALGATGLVEWLAKILDALGPMRRAEFLLCGRDVPMELNGQEHVVRDGRLIVRHRVGYLHDLPGIDTNVLKGALFIALHSGIGIEHPELSTSWPPTLRCLHMAAPIWLAVSSFNPVEHETAERALRSMWPGQLTIDRGGVNPAGSLKGPDAVGPFDGMHGKRNYCTLHARITSLERSADGWDLFD